MKRETIFVGLSGGVDSSVAALRLKREGHTVVGVFIKVWQPAFLTCNWERERLDAMRVAAHLDIPFLTFDAEAVYKKEVADYMVREYQAGRTPNPDVMCNKEVKFGAFLQFAKSRGADKVATGHYAQIEERDGHCALLRGADAGKDQSYFLWSLTHEQLASIYFPVGNSEKSAIRKEAKEAGLPTFNKEDSQGICFLGDVDIKEFLSHFGALERGSVLDAKGNVVGGHDGAIAYTLGQRHGFRLTARGTETKPHYVIARDIEKNTITVDTKPKEASGDSIHLTNCNTIEGWDGELIAQFRYRQKPFPVTVKETKEQCGILTVLTDIEKPSPGQSCVLYRENHCLGGGIIA